MGPPKQLERCSELRKVKDNRDRSRLARIILSAVVAAFSVDSGASEPGTGQCVDLFAPSAAATIRPTYSSREFNSFVGSLFLSRDMGLRLTLSRSFIDRAEVLTAEQFIHLWWTLTDRSDVRSWWYNRNVWKYGGADVHRFIHQEMKTRGIGPRHSNGEYEGWRSDNPWHPSLFWIYL